MNKRPGLDPFLEALARDYNTIVFTAAMPDYAGPVLDYIDPKGTLFHRRLYRSSCRQVRLAAYNSFLEKACIDNLEQKTETFFWLLIIQMVWSRLHKYRTLFFQLRPLTFFWAWWFWP